MLQLRNSLVLRTLSALALMPVVLAALFYGGWPFIALLLVAVAVSLKEWLCMAKLSAQRLRDGAGGVVYILLCFAAFFYIRTQYAGGEWLALALMLSIWASDIGAYVAGKTFKGPKMAPSISPNKTWAGFVGGLISSALVFWGFIHFAAPGLVMFFDRANLPAGLVNASAFCLLLIGALITVTGQAGDLLVSRLKRKVGVKDTGCLIPGHGGLLDRIDSLLLASLFFFLVLQIMDAR